MLLTQIQAVPWHVIDCCDSSRLNYCIYLRSNLSKNLQYRDGVRSHFTQVPADWLGAYLDSQNVVAQCCELAATNRLQYNQN